MWINICFLILSFFFIVILSTHEEFRFNVSSLFLCLVTALLNLILKIVFIGAIFFGINLFMLKPYLTYKKQVHECRNNNKTQ